MMEPSELSGKGADSARECRHQTCPEFQEGQPQRVQEVRKEEPLGPFWDRRSLEFGEPWDFCQDTYGAVP